MINPYNYLFYLFYRLFRTTKNGDRIAFGIVGLMFAPLMTHAVILLINLKANYFPDLLTNTDVAIAAYAISIVYLSTNYLLFERKKRYLRIVERISHSPKYQRIIAVLIILVYFSLPLIVKFIGSK